MLFLDQLHRPFLYARHGEPTRRAMQRAELPVYEPPPCPCTCGQDIRHASQCFRTKVLQEAGGGGRSIVKRKKEGYERRGATIAAGGLPCNLLFSFSVASISCSIFLPASRCRQRAGTISSGALVVLVPALVFRRGHQHVHVNHRHTGLSILYKACTSLAHNNASREGVPLMCSSHG